MATSNYLPPHRHISRPVPISASTALTNIQDYLSCSQTNAHLHPDCIFAERIGPTFAGNASTGGLVLQQLRRVEAGLRGEWMGVVPGLAFGKGKIVEVEVEESVERPARKRLQRLAGERAGELPAGDDSRLDEAIAMSRGDDALLAKRKFAAEDDYEHNPEAAMEHVGDEGGPGDDVANYQEQLRESGVRTFEGEIGDRSNAVRNVKKMPHIQLTGGSGPSAQNGKPSKEERKAAKQLRRQTEKVERARERQAGKPPEGTQEELPREELDDAELAIPTPAGMEKRGASEDRRQADKKVKRKKEAADTAQNADANGTNEDVEMMDAPAANPSTSSSKPYVDQDDRAKRKVEKHAKKLAKAERLGS